MGAILGWSPRQVRDTSLWDFTAARLAYEKAHSVDEGPEPPSNEEHDELVWKYRDV